MKFFCDSCNTKYSIPDDKIQGKILKVRCKNCGHIITVREPDAPMDAAPDRAGLPPRPQTQWYYSINGQSFGPFPESQLKERYASGELGDETYVWNETFTDWLPVAQVPAFADALASGQIIAPRNDTIGVSRAVEALDRSALPDEEQEGVAPLSEVEDEEDMEESTRQIDASAFQQHLASLHKSAPAAATAPAEDEDPFAELEASISRNEADASAISFDLPGPPLDDEDEEELFPDELAASARTPSGMFDLPTGGVAAASPGQDVIDPYSLDTSRATASLDFGGVEHSGRPTPGEDLSFGDDEGIGMSLGAAPRLGAEESERFEASGSLLIQLDQIQKQGRNQRMLALFGVFIAVASVAGVVMWRASIADKEEAERKRLEAARLAAMPKQKERLKFRTYSTEERQQLLTLSDERITAADIKAFEPGEDFPDDPPKADTTPDVKPQPVAVARASTTTVKKAPAERPAPKPEDRPKARKPLVDLRGIGVDRGSSTSLAEALSKSANGSKEGDGLRRTAATGQPRIATSKATSPERKGLDIKGVDIKTTARSTSGPKADTGLASSGASPTAKPMTLPKGLTKEAAQQGFQRVRRSVMLCRQRHARRDGNFQGGKFLMSVEVAGDGKVVGFTMTPNTLEHTIFGTCMEKNKRRWVFPAFEGKPVKIQRTFVLE